jgi:hypothetical protein
MAVTVIDGLEEIQIRHEHREGGVVTLRAREFLLCRLQKVPAIRQRGQCIGVRQDADGFLRLLDERDVFVADQDALTLRIHGRDLQRKPLLFVRCVARVVHLEKRRTSEHHREDAFARRIRGLGACTLRARKGIEIVHADE